MARPVSSDWKHAVNNVKVNAPTGRDLAVWTAIRAALDAHSSFIQGWRGPGRATRMRCRCCAALPRSTRRAVTRSSFVSSSMLSTKSKARSERRRTQTSRLPTVARAVRPHRDCVAGLAWRVGGQCSVDLVRCYSSCHRHVSRSAPSRRTTRVSFARHEPREHRSGSPLRAKTIRAGLPGSDPSAATFERYRGPMWGLLNIEEPPRTLAPRTSYDRPLRVLYQNGRSPLRTQRSRHLSLQDDLSGQLRLHIRGRNDHHQSERRRTDGERPGRVECDQGLCELRLYAHTGVVRSTQADREAVVLLRNLAKGYPRSRYSKVIRKQLDAMAAASFHPDKDQHRE